MQLSIKKLVIYWFVMLAFAASASARPIVVLLTDFGTQNEAAGLCHGAILSIDNEIEVVDLTHNVRPFDIRQASLILARANCFPKKTVFVSVVDPGVGTTRTSIAVKTKQDYFFVAPNNGLLTDVVKSQEVESVYLLEEKKINSAWQPGTFDGRDLYSPAGALLAKHNGDLQQIGRPARVEDIILLKPDKARVIPEENSIIGVYTRTDEPYGNVWTNITPADLEKIGIKPGDRLRVIAEKVEQTIPFVKTFGDVPEGKPLAYINSEGRLGLAINMDDLRKSWALTEGVTIRVQKVAK